MLGAVAIAESSFLAMQSTVIALEVQFSVKQLVFSGCLQVCSRVRKHHSTIAQVCKACRGARCGPTLVLAAIEARQALTQGVLKVQGQNLATGEGSPELQQELLIARQHGHVPCTASKFSPWIWLHAGGFQRRAIRYGHKVSMTASMSACAQVGRQCLDTRKPDLQILQPTVQSRLMDSATQPWGPFRPQTQTHNFSRRDQAAHHGCGDF